LTALKSCYAAWLVKTIDLETRSFVALEGSMRACEFCGRGAAELAQTGRRIWLGCSHCHRTWNIALEDYDVTASAEAVQDDYQGHPPVSLLRGYLIAVLTVVLALLARILLHPLLGDASPFLLFTPAVAITALYGGVGPGAVATALSTIVGSHFFLRSPGELVIEKWDRVILFAVVGAVITTSSALLRRSRRQLAASLWHEQKARAPKLRGNRSACLRCDSVSLRGFRERRSLLTIRMPWRVDHERLDRPCTPERGAHGEALQGASHPGARAAPPWFDMHGKKSDDGRRADTHFVSHKRDSWRPLPIG
jgi:uncharacterized protein DUF4118